MLNIINGRIQGGAPAPVPHLLLRHCTISCVSASAKSQRLFPCSIVMREESETSQVNQEVRAFLTDFLCDVENKVAE